MSQNGHGKVRNCLITDNGGNGVLFNGDCTSAVVSCSTIVGNKDEGVMFSNTNQLANITVSSCVIYGNGDVEGHNDARDQYAPANYGKIAYSCIGVNPGFNGTGLVVGDPRFVNAAQGDYHLKGFSPCVDSGVNEPWMVGAVDLDGNPRITGSTVDMGVYEFAPNGMMFILR